MPGCLSSNQDQSRSRIVWAPRCPEQAQRIGCSQIALLVVVTELTETAFARAVLPPDHGQAAATAENQLLFCFPLFNC